ncbi:MAG: hypothetical protein ACTHJY_07615, partial [Rhizobiaceae bacterium]
FVLGGLVLQQHCLFGQRQNHRLQRVNVVWKLCDSRLNVRIRRGPQEMLARASRAGAMMEFYEGQAAC